MGSVLAGFECAAGDDAPDFVWRYAGAQRSEHESGESRRRGVGCFGFLECGFGGDAGADAVAEQAIGDRSDGERFGARLAAQAAGDVGP